MVTKMEARLVVFIHNVTQQGGFQMTSQNWNPYYQYKTPNNYTSW